MLSKNHLISSCDSKKSAIFNSIFLILIFSSILPQKSSQQETINKFSTVKGDCKYDYGPQNVYYCSLNNVWILNPTDILEITGTHLTNHTDADVEGFEFEYYKMAYFNGEVLRKFENLKILNIAFIDLEIINENAFEICDKLEEVFIGGDPITSLPSQMLKNCENLRIFISYLNVINEIPEDLFGMTRNLEEFWVLGNKLSSLPENLLQNMENLKIFNAGGNLLTTLSPNLLKNAANLEEFFVSSNLLEDPEEIMNILSVHKNLKSIGLSSNNFPYFDFRFFSQFQELRTLDIGTNSGPKLTEISWYSLPNTLTQLTVYGIGEEIPENAFSKLANLYVLELTGSSLENLHKDTFKNLNSLKRIIVQYTSIKTIHPELFISQINLDHLDLSNNQIEELLPKVFEPLINIGIERPHGIRISSNKIKRLNANSFGQHQYLRYIDFSDNQIEAIERGIFSRFNPIIGSANFNFNFCVNKSLSGKNLDQSDDLLQCFSNWEGKPITAPTPTFPTTTISTATEDAAPEPENGSNFNTIVIVVVAIFASCLLVGLLAFLYKRFKSSNNRNRGGLN